MDGNRLLGSAMSGGQFNAVPYQCDERVVVILKGERLLRRVLEVGSVPAHRPYVSDMDREPTKEEVAERARELARRTMAQPSERQEWPRKKVDNSPPLPNRKALAHGHKNGVAPKRHPKG